MRSCALLVLVCWSAMAAAQTDSCSDEDTNFELVTGYVYSAPSDMLDSRAGTLMLAECIDMCRQNSSCQAFNYETGLCVLIDSNADARESEPGESDGLGSAIRVDRGGGVTFSGLQSQVARWRLRF